ncbi:MAG: hypothetical protein ABWY23_03465 [Mycetocola sp.]
MCALWQPERFEHIKDYEDWEKELIEDEDLERHVSEGTFVPLYLRADVVFDVVVRPSAGLSEREERFRLGSSDPYRPISRGNIAMGGLEHVGETTEDTKTFPLAAGTYSVIAHFIDWNAEPGSLGPDGAPTSDALPDLVIELHEEREPEPIYRTSLDTWARWS